ncbi:MAG TPA: succinate dehydrogenase assembly factor 2 [Gammaproteobacteria bacterium]|nr:succinate dehydrogenase assembly factor 2 [Gammaproteobacteria bacterium]
MSEPGPRLRWQCRRGMRELDELLQGFLERGYAQLDESQRLAFERLLGTQDNLLLEYLMGRSVPKDSGTADVVAKIRHAAHS